MKIQYVVEIQNKRSRWAFEMYFTDKTQAENMAKTFNKNVYIVRVRERNEK